MHRILMTEGASSSARQTLYCIPRPARVDVCASSLMSQCRFSSLVRRVRSCPRLSDSPRVYLDFIRDQVRSAEYDLLLPTNEEVYLLSRFRDELSPRIGIAVPPFESIRRVQGKRAFAATMAELNLPTPETLVATADEALADPPPFPCFLKTDFGTGSLSVRKVEDREMLVRSINELRLDGRFRAQEPLVMQQVVTGIHSTAQAIFQEGRLIAIHMTEAEEVGFVGSPMLRISVDHPHVEEHLRTLGERLAWHGPIFLEYFFDPVSRRPIYIEANPRIGEVVNAWLSGVNLVDAMIRISLGERLGSMPRGEFGVRSHLGFIWMISEAAKGAGRRRILQHRRRIRDLTRANPPVQNEITRPREDWLSILPAAKTLVHLLWSPGSASRHVRGAVDAYAVSSDAIYLIDHDAEQWAATSREQSSQQGI